VLLAGIYYLAARLVFPRNFIEWPDFDVYYFRHKKWVFGGILFCNIVAVVVMLSAGTPFMRQPLGLTNDALYFIPLVALLAIADKRTNIVLLVVLLAKYAVIPLLGYFGVGMHGQVF
jgi:hypothetical protein